MVDGISHSDQSAMPSEGSWSANGLPGTRFQTFGSMGSSVQSVVDPDLRLARFPGADDADRVTADLGVDDEEDPARRRRGDEDEPVFVRGRFIAEYTPFGSSKQVAASSKLTPYFLRFASAFFAFQEKRTHFFVT